MGNHRMQPWTPTLDTAEVTDPEKKAQNNSPYREDWVTLVVGVSRVEYRIHKSFLQRCPGLHSKLDNCFNDVIELPELDEDTAHTLMHYMYTGSYQTLQGHDMLSNTEKAAEYKKNFLVYCASRKYAVINLELEARSLLIKCADTLSVFEFLEIAAQAFCQLPENEEWFPMLIQARLQSAFSIDEAIFIGNRFTDFMGNDKIFDRVLMSIVVSVYKAKINTMNTAKNEEHRNDDEIDPRYENDTTSESQHQRRPQVELRREAEPQPEALLTVADPPPVSFLEGLPLSNDGTIMNANGVVVGRLTKGQKSRISRLGKHCDAKGQFLDKKGKVIGLAETVLTAALPAPTLQVEPEGVKSQMVEPEVGSEPKPIPGYDLVATPGSEYPDVSILDGLTVEMDGKIYSSNGAEIGEVTAGDAPTLHKIKSSCNGRGELLNRMGTVVGKARTLPLTKALEFKPTHSKATGCGEPEAIAPLSSDRISPVGISTSVNDAAPKPLCQQDDDCLPCASRAKHLNGDGWENCISCRGIVQGIFLRLTAREEFCKDPAGAIQSILMGCE